MSTGYGPTCATTACVTRSRWVLWKSKHFCRGWRQTGALRCRRTGRRISEALHLRVKDVDFEFRTVTVRCSKGGNDRAVMLPATLVSAGHAVGAPADRCAGPPPPVRSNFATGLQARGGLCRHRAPGHTAHVAAFVRYAPASSELRHPHGASLAGTQRCQHHDDLHPRGEGGRRRGAQPAGCAGGAMVTAHSTTYRLPVPYAGALR